MSGWMVVMMGYRPFLDPLPIEGEALWLILPLVLVVAVVYKALKGEGGAGMGWQSVRLMVSILIFLAVAGAVLWGMLRVASG